MFRVGSNQYKKIRSYTLLEKVLMTLLVIASGAFFYYITQPRIVSPLSDNPVIPQVYAAEAGDTQSIVGYIYQVFSQEGHEAAMKAIECAKSESGLNPFAVGKNKDSVDRGIFQINSKYHPKMTDPFNWKKNIDYAYQLYKVRGWSAWYGRGCK